MPELARTFSEAGLVIVSGLAIGWQRAHSGGLAGRGSTIAVLGLASTSCIRAATSHSRTKSRSAVRLCPNFRSAHRLTREFSPRNRLISGLARGCQWSSYTGFRLAHHSRLAVEQGREVFAIPGSIHSPLSEAVIADQAGREAGRERAGRLEESAQQGYPKLDCRTRSSHDLLDKMGFDPCDIDA